MSIDQTNLGFLGYAYQSKLIFNIFIDSSFAKKVIPQLAPHHFDEQRFKMVYSIVKEYYEKYEVPPNIDNVEQIINSQWSEDASKQLLLASLKEFDGWRAKVEKGERNSDAQHIRETIYDFIKNQVYKKIGQEFQRRLEAGDKEGLREIPELMREADLIGSDDDWGHDPFEVTEAELDNRYPGAIPTGIRFIDEAIKALPKGKLGMILAGQGGGKSTTLTIIGDNALLQGKKVLHIIFDENSVEDCKRLYWAKWSGVEPDSMSFKKEHVSAKIKEAKAARRAGKLVIKRMSSDGTTIPKIKSWIKAYQDMYGFKFDLVVLDYIDEVETHKEGKSKWDGEADVVKSYHSMLVDFDIPGWTATQAKKESNDKKYLLYDDCGGSVAKLKKSQLVIGIGSDLEQRRCNLATFTIIKCNFSKSSDVFEDVHYDRGICAIGNPLSHAILAPDLAGKYDNEPEVDYDNESYYKPSPRTEPVVIPIRKELMTEVVQIPVPKVEVPAPKKSLGKKDFKTEEENLPEKRSNVLDAIRNTDFS